MLLPVIHSNCPMSWLGRDKVDQFHQFWELITWVCLFKWNETYCKWKLVQLALKWYRFCINLVRFLFLVNFYFLVCNSAWLQNKPRLIFNNLSYPYQNLTGLKRLKTRQIILQHVKNSYLNELNMNFGINYKTGKNWVMWVGLPTWKVSYLSTCMKLNWSLNVRKSMLMLKHWYITLVLLLQLSIYFEMAHSQGSGLWSFILSNF